MRKRVSGEERMGKSELPVPVALFPLSLFFFFPLILFTAWDQKEKIHAIQSPAQILLHQ